MRISLALRRESNLALCFWRLTRRRRWKKRRARTGKEKFRLFAQVIRLFVQSKQVCARAHTDVNCIYSTRFEKRGNKRRRISVEYQYRESNHLLFETEDYWFLYTQFRSPSLSSFLHLELCVHVVGDSRTSFKRRWCDFSGVKGVKRGVEGGHGGRQGGKKFQ